MISFRLRSAPAFWHEATDRSPIAAHSFWKAAAPKSGDGTDKRNEEYAPLLAAD